MPKIGLANNVEIEYDKGISKEADYKFTQSIPRVGEFAKEGVRFKLEQRKEPPNETEHLYIFTIAEDDITFELFESAFHNHMDEGRIVKVDN